MSSDANRWDEFCMAHSATTINENGICWQYAVPRRVVQRSSALQVLESPRMSWFHTVPTCISLCRKPSMIAA